MALQLQIEKLSSWDDYDHWALTVRAYLEMKDLWTVVVQGPDQSKESLAKDKRAKFILLCLISPSNTFMFHIDSEGTARDLWFYLEKKLGKVHYFNPFFE